MLNPSRMFVAIEPVDLRNGMDSLMALAKQTGTGDFIDHAAAWVFRNQFSGINQETELKSFTGMALDSGSVFVG